MFLQKINFIRGDVTELLSRKDTRRLSTFSLAFFEDISLRLENHLDQFLDANNKVVSVSSLIKKFNAKKLPALRGKPKIFWFQFCRRGKYIYLIVLVILKLLRL